MQKMIRLANGDQAEIDKIKKERLVGIEYQDHIFTLAVSNMIIHGDGKTNIIKGDCFKKILDTRRYKPTVGLLNPPYNDVTGIDELKFIENNLSGIEVNGVVVAIVPMRCALYQTGKGAIIKQRLLDSHTLVSVMSMPHELFYPIAIVTCIMVFRAHIPHAESNRKTWFGYWKDDGFVKVKHRGRVDTNSLWSGIKSRWLEMYRERESHAGESVLQYVGASDEWCAEAYMETDFSSLSHEDFIKVKRSYLAHCIAIGETGLFQSLAGESDFMPLHEREWKWFSISDIFEIKKGKRLTKSDMLDGRLPYLGASAMNNGITQWIDAKPIHDANTISVNYDGSVGEAFYQPFAFWASDAVNVLYPKLFKLTPEIGLFFCAIIRKEKYRYSYGRKWHLSRMSLTKIKLPVKKDGLLDFRFMRNYIKSLPYSSDSTEEPKTAETPQEEPVADQSVFDALIGAASQPCQ